MKTQPTHEPICPGCGNPKIRHAQHAGTWRICRHCEPPVRTAARRKGWPCAKHGGRRTVRLRADGSHSWVCAQCETEKGQRPKVVERKSPSEVKLCEIHDEAKFLRKDGTFACPACYRDYANKTAAEHRALRRDDPLNDVQGPVRLPEVFPSDSMWLRALALRIDRYRRRSDARASGRQEEVRA